MRGGIWLVRSAIHMHYSDLAVKIVPVPGMGSKNFGLNTIWKSWIHAKDWRHEAKWLKQHAKTGRLSLYLKVQGTQQRSRPNYQLLAADASIAVNEVSTHNALERSECEMRPISIETGKLVGRMSVIEARWSPRCVLHRNVVPLVELRERGGRGRGVGGVGVHHGRLFWLNYILLLAPVSRTLSRAPVYGQFPQCLS